MTQPDLTYADSGLAPQTEASEDRRADSTDDTRQRERRYPGIGLLVMLASAIAFYGGVAALIRRFL